MNPWAFNFFFGQASTPSYSATVTGPGGTIYQYVDVTFTVSTDVPTPTYTWSVASGGSVISGQGTASAVIRFSGTGSRTVTCDVGGGGSASDSETVTVTEFTPTLISNMAGWWDASSLSYVTLDGSNNVTAMTDRSGNSRGMSQATLLKRPPWSSSVRNGLGGFALDNVNDIVETSLIAATNWIGSGTETTVVTFGSSTGGRFVAALNTARSGTTERFQMDMLSSNPQLLVDVNGSSATVSVPSITDGSFYLDFWRWSSGQKVYVRRVKGGSSTDYESSGTLTQTFSASMGFYIGIGTANNIQGNNCESMVFARRLTDTEVRQIIDYFQGKWGTI